MNKKNIMGTLLIAAVASLTMTSCNKSNPQMDEKPQTGVSSANMKISN